MCVKMQVCQLSFSLPLQLEPCFRRLLFYLAGRYIKAQYQWHNNITCINKYLLGKNLVKNVKMFHVPLGLKESMENIWAKKIEVQVFKIKFNQCFVHMNVNNSLIPLKIKWPTSWYVTRKNNVSGKCSYQIVFEF